MSASRSQTHPPAAGGTLYLVATPIGNLKDITLRALEVLESAHLIACEDTRVSRTLLSHYGIAAPTISYHEHNAEKQHPRLLEILAQGKSVALISDAGTPLISDPGYRLVREVTEAGYAVVPIPGPSSVLAALCISGLPTDRFLFAGFLPTKTSARKTALEELKSVAATLVFFEAANRLTTTLSAMLEIYGNRQAVIARELTKRFEEAQRGAISELLEYYEQKPPKGEAVIVVASPSEEETQIDDATIDHLLLQALASMRVKEAAASVAKHTGLSRTTLYARALFLQGKS